MPHTPHRDKSPFERSDKTSRSPAKRKDISPLIEKEEKKLRRKDDSKKELMEGKKMEELKKSGDLNEKLNALLDMVNESKLERRDLNNKLENLCELLVREREERKLEVENLREEMQMMKKEINRYQEKIDELENRGRRVNLVFKGVEEKNEENWSETQKVLSSTIEEHFHFKPNSIGRAHRLGQFRANAKYPRMIVARFERELERKNILENKYKLKNTKIFVEEDFSQEVREVRRLLWKEAIEERKKGKRATVRYKSLIVEGEEFRWNKEEKQIKKIVKKTFNYNQKN